MSFILHTYVDMVLITIGQVSFKLSNQGLEMQNSIIIHSTIKVILPICSTAHMGKSL